MKSKEEIIQLTKEDYQEIMHKIRYQLAIGQISAEMAQVLIGIYETR